MYITFAAYSSLYNLIFNEMKRTKSNYRSQEKYAEALNCTRKRPAPQSDRELVCQLCRCIDRLERELTATKKQLNGIACSHAKGEDAVPHSQSPASRLPRRGGSKRRIAYMIFEEDLIQIATASQRSFEEPFRSSVTQRVHDEL